MVRPSATLYKYASKALPFVCLRRATLGVILVAAMFAWGNFAQGLLFQNKNGMVLHMTRLIPTNSNAFLCTSVDDKEYANVNGSLLLRGYGARTFCSKT